MMPRAWRIGRKRCGSSASGTFEVADDGNRSPVVFDESRLTPIRAPVGCVIAQLRPVAVLQEKWPAQSCQNRILVVRDQCTGNRRQRLVLDIYPFLD